MSNGEGPCGEGASQQSAKCSGGAARGAKTSFAGNVKPLDPGADASCPSSIPLIIWNDQIYDASSRQLKTRFNKKGVRKKRTKLVVVPEALEMLKKVSKPVAVLGICGPARSGKSYILSKMLGCPDAFALGHTFDPDTFGIWLGTSYLDCGDHAMLLLDTEGVHAVDAKGEDDIRILVMTVLLSSFLIYNSRSSFESRDMDTMRCFTKLANAIVVNTKSSGETEKEGGASKQSTEDTNKEYRQRFPDFLWLLRDVILDIPHGKKNDHVYAESDDEDDEENAEEDDGKDTTTPALMTAREFMLHQFRKNEKVGNSIIGLFATVNCVMLPPPGDADALRHVEQSECEQKLDPDFTAKVAKLVVDLQEKVEKKKGFQHVQRVDGTTLADLTEIYLEAVNEAVNEGAQLCLEGSWNSAVEIGCSSLIEKHAKQYDTEMEELLSDKLPLEEVADSQVARDQAQSKMALMQVHSQVLQVKKRSLIDATKYYVPTENAKEWRADLLRRLEFKIIQTKESDDGRKVVTGGILHGFVTKNRKLSRDQCAKCFDDLFQPTKAKLEGSHTAKESDATQKRQQYTSNQYMEDWTKLQTEYFKKAVGPAKQDVWTQKLEFLDQFEASVKMLGGYQEREYANKKKLEAKEAEIRSLERENKNQIAKERRNNAQITYLQEERKHFEMRMQQLQDKLSEAIRDATTGLGKEKAIRLQLHNQRLEEECFRLKHNLRQQRHEYQQQILMLEQRQLQQNSQRLQEECSRLEQQLQQQKEQFLREYEQQRKKSLQEQQKYRQQTLELQQRLSITQAEVQQLQLQQNSRGFQEECLQEHREQTHILQQRLDVSQAEVQQLQRNGQQLQKECSDLKQQLRQQKEQFLQEQQEHQRQREQSLQEHREQTHTLQQRLDVSQAEVQQLQQNSQQLQEECSRLEQQLRQQREQSAQEQEQHQQQTRVLQQRLQAEVQQLQQNSQRLQEECSRLEQQLRQQRELSSQEQEEHQHTIQVLQQRLDTALTEVQQLRHTPQVASRHRISWNLTRQEIQVLSEIGRGAWGTVARGEFRGQPVAVKWPHPVILNEHTIERLRREVQIMAQVKHPNLLRFIGAVFDNQLPLQPPLIVTELLNMNLRTAYENERLTSSSKIPIFREVAYALHYLHEHQEPIIHRDVSAPNVLLEELPSGMWRAKVSDFGSANLARLARTMGEGAIIYAAPETLPDIHSPPLPQTTKIDVYSYGILLCEVITSQFPDPDRLWSMLQQVKSQWSIMYELIMTCTKRCPGERPTMAEVLDKLNELPHRQPQPQS